MSNRTSVCRIFVRWVLLAAVALLLALGLVTAPALAQGPDFGTIDDPLDGNYEFYDVSDLLIARTNPLDSDTKSQVDNYILKTENETINSQGNKNVNVPPCWLTSGRQPQQTRIGRFLNLPYDVIVTLAPTTEASGSDCAASGGQHNMSLHIQSTEDSANTATQFTMSAAQTALATGDFTGDGFDELFIMSNEKVLVAGAANVNNRSEGMKFGPATALPATDYAPRYDPTTGDFNGDGILDVAWIGMDYVVHFASVCPGAMTDSICANAEALQVLIDPLDSQAQPIQVTPNINIDSNGCSHDAHALVGGRFATGVDGLVVFDCTLQSNGTVELDTVSARYYLFLNSWGIVGGSPIDQLNVDANVSIQQVLAEAARIDVFTETEQVIFAVGGYYPACYDLGVQYASTEDVGVVSFDGNTLASTLTQGKIGPCNKSRYPWLNGLAVGHYASIPNNANSEAAYNQHIATLLNNGTVRFYEVNAPSSYQPKILTDVALESTLGLNEKAGLNDPQVTNWLVTGDLQGRSARLGPPTIVRISQHTEPSIILGHPPMHADFIVPDQSTATISETVNFSVVPNTYFSRYQTDVQNSNQSSRTHTTSHAYGSAESANEKFKVNVPLVSSLSGSFTQAWQQQSTTTTSDNNYTYSSQGFDSSTNTGFGDQIWFTTYDFNIYYYPVIGQTVCPNEQPDCSESEKQPLYVSFSGPSNSQSRSIDGARVPWYQPVHEPGQIFSYPPSYEQLKNRYPGLLPLSSTTPTGFYTDDSTQQQSANWTDESGNSVTTGSVHTHSFKTTNSVTVGPPKLEMLEGSGAQVSGSFAYNSSSSVSSLNVTQTSMGSSTGVSIVKPGSFRQPGLYEYLVEPYIFGLTLPPGTVQSVPIDATKKTTGPIHTAYAANPLDEDAGTWWVTSPYQEHIDIALNHPQRWTKTSGTNTNIQGKLNCLQAGTSTVNCVTFNDPSPDDLWNSEFYQMRGLLVTVGGAEGPQRASATVGDDIVLQARVYNYSLKDMASTSKVHVRFYQQEIDDTTKTLVGSSTLIAEETLDPLPGFNSQSTQGAPNWGLATTSFTATAAMASKYYIFWVVVWAENANGQLVQELPYHGLSEIPGTLDAIGDVPLEQTTITDGNGDPKTTSFSNNVGYLAQDFHIYPQQSVAQQTTGAADVRASQRAGELRIDNLNIVRSDAATGAIALEERLLITADITSVGGVTEGATVLFLEGSVESAIAYDMELIPHIGSDSSSRVSIPYRPTTCGVQEMVVVARNGMGTLAQAAVTVDVACPASSLYFPVSPRQGDGVGP